MVSEGGLARMSELCGDFNCSLLHFLPKKVSGSLQDGTSYYEVDSVRPFNVTNSDNRLLASAVRLLVESWLSPRISPSQRGFITGRSMIANLIDIDEAMATTLLEDDAASAFFFDFAAAFPSVEQEMMHKLFESLGWPDWLLRFIHILYQNNWCHIVLGGSRHAGFSLTRGIRQGCPLSPLLFAVASDLLLRRLERLFPRACTRAYADDLAMVLPSFALHVRTLQELFSEYGRLSGLRLSIQKTVMVPPFTAQAAELRARLVAEAPAWGCLAIDSKAKYLGMVIGPGCGTSSWEGPLRKYLERAQMWGRLGIGLLLTLQAYGIFVASVLSFVGQLAALPDE